MNTAAVLGRAKPEVLNYRERDEVSARLLDISATREVAFTNLSGLEPWRRSDAIGRIQDKVNEFRDELGRLSDNLFACIRNCAGDIDGIDGSDAQGRIRSVATELADKLYSLKGFCKELLSHEEKVFLCDARMRQRILVDAGLDPQISIRKFSFKDESISELERKIGEFTDVWSHGCSDSFERDTSLFLVGKEDIEPFFDYLDEVFRTAQSFVYKNFPENSSDFSLMWLSNDTFKAIAESLLHQSTPIQIRTGVDRDLIEAVRSLGLPVELAHDAASFSSLSADTNLPLERLRDLLTRLRVHSLVFAGINEHPQDAISRLDKDLYSDSEILQHAALRAYRWIAGHYKPFLFVDQSVAFVKSPHLPDTTTGRGWWSSVAEEAAVTFRRAAVERIIEQGYLHSDSVRRKASLDALHGFGPESVLAVLDSKRISGEEKFEFVYCASNRLLPLAIPGLKVPNDILSRAISHAEGFLSSYLREAHTRASSVRSTLEKFSKLRNRNKEFAQQLQGAS
ncbi:MAG: hypothetical protein KDD53_02475 [Bdellovibrionales bacterium]|nr:hypothetical protein [Bdellovibrionales bacterium]